ncbi:MAG TPA: succinate dehydrogenase cytochrome b subunit [Thermoanaerobaculia bacterium]|nr:succinate dehydrogenase cytochrome b subunit [Thermoanaerobaculia bacterium]
MGRIGAFWRSLVGKKVVMAVTGVILLLYIIGHLLGNLQIFEGPERLNAYAAFLKSTGELLWAVRIVLLVSLVLHVIASVQVSLASKRSRPADYIEKKSIETSYAARTMIWSGPLIFLYVVYHLAMFTFLVTGPGYSPTDVYRNEVQAFQVPAISAFYVVAIIFLGMHLYHGAWSMLHTLGASNPRYRVLRRTIAPIVAIAITVGYIAIPIAVLLGFIS